MEGKKRTAGNSMKNHRSSPTSFKNETSPGLSLKQEEDGRHVSSSWRTDRHHHHQQIQVQKKTNRDDEKDFDDDDARCGEEAVESRKETSREEVGEKKEKDVKKKKEATQEKIQEREEKASDNSFGYEYHGCPEAAVDSSSSRTTDKMNRGRQPQKEHHHEDGRSRSQEEVQAEKSLSHRMFPLQESEDTPSSLTSKAVSSSSSSCTITFWPEMKDEVKEQVSSTSSKSHKKRPEKNMDTKSPEQELLDWVSDGTVRLRRANISDLLLNPPAPSFSPPPPLEPIIVQMKGNALCLEITRTTSSSKETVIDSSSATLAKSGSRSDDSRCNNRRHLPDDPSSLYAKIEKTKKKPKDTGV